ncbi:MAG: aminotransferase [Nitratireductor sp.]|uniref:SIS domain-containing protein n=1 Tax=Nitratireductor sp. B36 TaxID=2762059 RepID=UPI000C8920CA|nr:SIS domain-containing protein [Nitratireductor sp. B36]MAS14158.1 aminotransferase [Nitratireductor sp.]MCC5779985.1 SIS domain-containing protein [Nitratireductor sp. B36]
MTDTPSLMFQETAEAAEAVDRLFAHEAKTFAELGRVIAERGPAVVSMSARGSSDHAASFFKYLFEIHTGIPVASIGPSVASVYDASLKLERALHITISQSGGSPDIVAAQASAKKGGAVTLAVVNVADSPLAKAADIVLPIHAGPERSVAATKSFIASAAALAGVTQAASGDAALKDALGRLPGALAAACDVDWEPALPLLTNAGSIYTAGRGPGFAIALEAALKAKETAQLHAEAFSLAELMHGPMQLVDKGFPILAFVPEDAALASSAQSLEKLRGFGAQIASFSSRDLGECTIRTPSTGHGQVDPLVSLVGYYRLIERVARERGLNPDTPDKLKKVTETI